MFEINARLTEKISAMLDRLALDTIRGMLDNGDQATIWPFIEEMIFGFR